MMIASMAFAYSAMAALCLSSRKYDGKTFNNKRNQPPLWVLKALAFCCLIVSLALCVWMWGVTVGVSAYWIVLAVPAFICVLVNTYLPRYFMKIAVAVFILAVFSGLAKAVLVMLN